MILGSLLALDSHAAVLGYLLAGYWYVIGPAEWVYILFIGSQAGR